jgi:hypothetical protein
MIPFRQVILPLAARATGSNTAVNVENTFGAKGAILMCRCTAGAAGTAATLQIWARDTSGNAYKLGEDVLACEAGTLSVLMVHPALPVSVGVSLPLVIPKAMTVRSIINGPGGAVTYEVTMELL